MECIESEGFDHFIDEPEDLCDSILSKFRSSNKEDHQHLCAVIGAMSQELKDQNVSLSPVAYFGATVSSLDRLYSDISSLESPNHAVDALLTILSVIMPRVSRSVLKKKMNVLSELLVRVIQCKALSPAATSSGLMCIGFLLKIRHASDWEDVSQLYGFLLNFITDSHVKIRQQSHLCIRDLLESFQRTPLLVSASEGITKIFEKQLLLTGGSNTAEGAAGAQKVLFVLDLLKDSLSYMDTKYKTTILERFKTLLALHQPLVTRRITDSLYLLCINPTSQVSPKALCDLLSSLALSASSNETSADGMTFTARLLDVGMKKLYAANRQICTTKLPLVFNALKDILAFDHEEALYAATQTMKNLIEACIEDDLIKEGVDQIRMSANKEARKSGPAVIDKLCATIASLLDYQYFAAWDLAFQILSSLFDRLGEYSSYFLCGALENLSDMQKMPDEEFPYRKQLHECIGSALQAMGPENFLSLLPLKLEADDPSEVNIWLFPILKQYTVGAHLNFYCDSLLAMVGRLKKRSHKFELEGRIFSSRSTDALVYSMWSLLPSFCNYPLDTAQSFDKLEKPLCKALNEDPDLHGVICSSLQILIKQNRHIKEGINALPEDDINMSMKRAMEHYTEGVASANLGVLKTSARSFLSVLSNVYLKSTNYSSGSLQAAIGEFASIADKEVVMRFFKLTMQKLLKVTQNASNAGSTKSSMQIDSASGEKSLSAVRAQLFDLAVSFLPGLGVDEINLLLVAIASGLKQDADGMVQKKAYKVLSTILKNSDGFIQGELQKLSNLMVEVLPLCHFSAKRYRLDCLYHLIVHLSKDEPQQRWREITSSFLTEIVLALKEDNKKTRNRAYDIIIQIGHACGDEETGGKKENLLQFFNMIAGGLAGETPHMISAAVKGLARLAYEFSDLVSTVYTLLPSTFLLLQRKNREIVKANLGLLKVIVAKSPAESLQSHLRSMVEGLLSWQDDRKNHFKAKVKHLLEMLVKKCGLDAVKAVMPEEHLKLLTNIRKIKERRERKLAANSETRSYQSKATTTSRLSRWNHTNIFSDFNEEEASDAEYMDTGMVSGRKSMLSSRLKSKANSLRSKRISGAAKRLREDSLDQFGDEPLDLLDQCKTRSALHTNGHHKRILDSDDEPEFDSEGRLIIREEGKKKRERKTDDVNLDNKSEAGSHRSAKSSKKEQKRQKTSESGWSYTGHEYASKKARGDVKRQGKLEPYAYWPLDRKMVSRRPEQRAAARKGMASVVKLTKKLEGKSASSVLSMKALKVKKSKKKGNKRK